MGGSFEKKHIVVIGGGASGAMALIKLRQELGSAVRLTLLDPIDQLGRGKAYSSNHDHHLLNVPVERMILFQNRPLDFLEWLNQHQTAQKFIMGSFVPRHYFGSYLAERITKIQFHHERSRATSLAKRSNGWLIHTDSSVPIFADAVILASGYVTAESNQRLLKLKNEASKSRVLGASDFAKMQQIMPKDRIVIIGSGLTAVDVFLHLSAQSPQQSITFLSRRGLMPHAHQASHKDAGFRLSYLPSMSPVQILKIIRSIQKINPHLTPVLMLQIRAQAPKIWACWTSPEKRQFIEHLKPYWEIIRHKLPSAINAQLQQALITKTSRLIAGRIESTHAVDQVLKISLRNRISQKIETIDADWIILATDVKIDQSIEVNSLSSGISKCPFGLGYLSEGAPGLWILGPASKGSHWEITSIPDLSLQADQIIVSLAKWLSNPLSLNSFHHHPYQVQETYFQHLNIALQYSKSLMKLSLQLLVHAVAPFLYSHTVGEKLRTLAQKLIRRRLAGNPQPRVESQQPAKDVTRKAS